MEPTRKRVGRPPKSASTNTSISSTTTQSNTNIPVAVMEPVDAQMLDESNSTELSYSTDPDSSLQNSLFTSDDCIGVDGASSVECRRSSRKKVMKFDVRDLLNKNRKLHKIQIEARIDSNVPSTSRSANVSTSAVGSGTPDLNSKQQTFILQRYSMSEQQSPQQQQQQQQQQLRIPPVLPSDVTLPLLKPKPSSSLIVMQMESNTSTTTTTSPSTSGNVTTTTAPTIQKKISVGRKKIVERLPILTGPDGKPVQRKRGRPPKVRTNVDVDANATVYCVTVNDENPPDDVAQPKTEHDEMQQSQQDVILEISSSNSESENCDAETKSSTKLKEGKQRNFAAVSFLQESFYADNDSDNVSAPDFIVAAVEEIIDSSAEKVSVPTSTKTAAIDVETQPVMVPSAKEPSNIKVKPSTSEAGHNKSYKKFDNLRVNLKRVLVPSSATTEDRTTIIPTTTNTSTITKTTTAITGSSSTDVVKETQRKEKTIMESVYDTATDHAYFKAHVDVPDSTESQITQVSIEQAKHDTTSTESIAKEEIKMAIKDEDDSSSSSSERRADGRNKKKQIMLPLKKQKIKFQNFQAIEESKTKAIVETTTPTTTIETTTVETPLITTKIDMPTPTTTTTPTTAVETSLTTTTTDIPTTVTTTIPTATDIPTITTPEIPTTITQVETPTTRTIEVTPTETLAITTTTTVETPTIKTITTVETNSPSVKEIDMKLPEEELPSSEESVQVNQNIETPFPSTTIEEEVSAAEMQNTPNAQDASNESHEVETASTPAVLIANNEDEPIKSVDLPDIKKSIEHKENLEIEEAPMKNESKESQRVEVANKLESAKLSIKTNDEHDNELTNLVIKDTATVSTTTTTTTTTSSASTLSSSAMQQESKVLSDKSQLELSFEQQNQEQQQQQREISTPVEVKTENLIVQVQPARRGRKPKNKATGKNVEQILSLPEIPTTSQELPKTSNVPAASEMIISSASELPETGTVTATPNTSITQTESKISEDRIPRAPPKKRLSKIQVELESTEPTSGTSMESLNTNMSVVTNENAEILVVKPQSTKKSSLGALATPDIGKEKLQVKKTKKIVKSEESKKEHKQKVEMVESPTTISNKKNKKKHEEVVKEEIPSDNSTAQTDEKDKDKEPENKPEKDKEQLTDEKSSPLMMEGMLDEKSAKKKRQRRLKEAFEAALSDASKLPNKQEPEEPEITKTEQLLENMPSATTTTTVANESIKREIIEQPIGSILKLESRPLTPSEPEEDPDPLKDIEKFIEDGVNLLKRGYKVGDENSVDDVVNPIEPKIETVTSAEEQSIVPVKEKEEQEDEHATDTQLLQINYETPADTPINTPSTTPPPKSPVHQQQQEESADETSLRRSHRIKQITRTPKALVGRGLVREKERISMKDDVETKSHYSLDNHLMDLAEVEAKNAKFLKDMEERLSNFHVIKENEYKCERIVSREARKMLCDCFLTCDEEERGELGCGEDCLNRLLMIECGPDCNVKVRCTNRRFQRCLCAPCRVFRTEKKGFGIMADVEILPGEFIMEYVGEVIDSDDFERRRQVYSREKNRHYYFMALRSDAIIDATVKGNISRFINHSCDPNAETQKWTVNGELRIGFFSRKSIMPGEEITFDYQYQRYGREAQRCYCESANCRGWIGEEPNSDEGEQLDEVDSDEDNLAASLLADDDEDDSDESVTDAEDVQKKLEIAAAEAKLTPFGDVGKSKSGDAVRERTKKKVSEEYSKSKLKKLLSKVAEKVAAKKQKQQLKDHEKKQRKRGGHAASDVSPSKSRFQEDPDIEDEVHFLSRCGLKNQSDTLRLSRLMVRAKLVQTRHELLQILRKGELPCRRLFLDYHGLRLLHGWMSEDGGDPNTRMELLLTLECLPIANKTMLTDSKVYQAVENWSRAIGSTSTLSPNSDESSKESTSNAPTTVVTPAAAATPVDQAVLTELQKLATKLMCTWDSLPEIFRIPKRERIEQMKEHEREADRQYAATATVTAEEDSNNGAGGSKLQTGADRYQRDRFGRSFSSRFAKPYGSKDVRTINSIVGVAADPRRRDAGIASLAGDKHLSKEQRRELFAAKVARDEAEKRLAEERRAFETKCRFFGLDPKRTRPQDMPFCVNPSTGQWYSVERQPILTPPSYAHVQVPVKPKSVDPADYQLPAVVATLPPQWKFAITPQGKIYYYHVEHRVPQWEPPTKAQMYGSNSGANGAVGGVDKSDGASETDSETDADSDGEGVDPEEDQLLLSMDAEKLKAYIERKVEARRQERYARLVGERAISPRREEDRVYNQLEVRKYKENKEKIRKRKEEIRRRRAMALKYGNVDEKSDNGNSTSTSTTLNTSAAEIEGNASESIDAATAALPIQDYLLSSDEEDIIKAECNNSPLLEKIVQGDKIVDELDALTTKRVLKRVLPPHRELSSSSQTSGSSSSNNANTASTSSAAVAESKQEHKKRKLEKREKSKKSKESDAKYRKLREKFRCEIAGIIVAHLKPYRKDSCQIGRIQTDDDFNHLARKLTHFVMIKELKYCESVGQTLVVTESVKNKSREFIKKYMAKYGDVYEKPKNDPEFKDIPFLSSSTNN